MQLLWIYLDASNSTSLACSIVVYRAKSILCMHLLVVVIVSCLPVHRSKKIRKSFESSNPNIIYILYLFHAIDATTFHTYVAFPKTVITKRGSNRLKFAWFGNWVKCKYEIRFTNKNQNQKKKKQIILFLHPHANHLCVAS